jgi:hypothetical protein
MPKEQRVERKLEAQPLQASPMPEYRFQDAPGDNDIKNSVDFCCRREGDAKLDLRGVSLNLS